MKPALLMRLAAGVLLIASLVAALAVLPIREYLLGVLDWISNLGPLGPVALAGIYVITTVLFIPGSILTLGAGFAFGVVRGTVAVSIGSTLGATAAFLVGRTWARRLIEERLGNSPTFAALDRAVAGDGFKIVLLTRLSPLIPFNLLNYAYGLTRVSLRDYVLASWLGMLPATVVYVYVGSAVKSLADLAAGRLEHSWLQTALLVAGLVATALVTLYIARAARRELRKAVKEELPSPNKGGNA
jgi:uncharacterized membrane protein YdjX (TVP38/TMEM64 family)